MRTDSNIRSKNPERCMLDWVAKNFLTGSDHLGGTCIYLTSTSNLTWIHWIGGRFSKHNTFDSGSIEIFCQKILQDIWWIELQKISQTYRLRLGVGFPSSNILRPRFKLLTAYWVFSRFLVEKHRKHFSRSFRRLGDLVEGKVRTCWLLRVQIPRADTKSRLSLLSLNF